MTVAALVRKDLKRISGDRKALIVNLALPLVLTAIMGFSFGGGSGPAISAIPLAVVDNDIPGLLRDRIAEGLAESGYFSVTWADSTSAAAMVRQGDVSAALVLPRSMWSDLLDGRDVEVGLWKDPGSPLKAGIVQQILTRGFLRYQAGAAAYDALWPEDRRDRPLGEVSVADYFSGDFNTVWQRFRNTGSDPDQQEFGDRFLTVIDHQVALSSALDSQQIELTVHDKSSLSAAVDEDGPSLFDYFLPSFAVFFLMFAAAAGARDLHRERDQLTLQRQLLSPMSGWQFIVGKWAAVTLQGVIQLGALFVAGALLFRVNLGPDAYSLAVTIVLTSAAAAGFFLMMALVVPTEKVMDSLSTVVVLVSAMIGGNFVPVESMPGWAHHAGRFVFNYWANLGFTAVVVKDHSLPGAVLPLLVLAAAALTLFVLNVLVFSLRARRGGLA